MGEGRADSGTETDKQTDIYPNTEKEREGWGKEREVNERERA